MGYQWSHWRTRTMVKAAELWRIISGPVGESCAAKQQL
jgi:hypothetical protein